MHTRRALVAANPRRFGRARAMTLDAAIEPSRTVSDDVQLFAATFAGGFVFVSILLA